MDYPVSKQDELAIMMRLRKQYELVMFSGLPEEVWLAVLCLEPVARRVAARTEEDEDAGSRDQDGPDQ